MINRPPPKLYVYNYFNVIKSYMRYFLIKK